MRNKNTIEFPGIWEQLNNPAFKPIEFDRFKNLAGLNRFSLSPKQWIQSTNAIGFIVKSGRHGGGTYAHQDLARLYEVPTKVLKQSVKRNLERFPLDFMFELNEKEIIILRSQFVTLN